MATSTITSIVKTGGAQNNWYAEIGNLLICFGRVASSVPASSSVDETVTFAKSFSATPVVVMAPIVGSDVNVDFAYLKSRTASSCVITLKNEWTGANSIVVCWIAIGHIG